MSRLVALGLLLATPALAGTCDDPFADDGQNLELHLRLDRATWDALRLEKNPGLACDLNYTTREVEFRCGDSEPWLRIGARHKRGDQRGVDAPEKPPLKLDFNFAVKGQRWPAAAKDLGLRKLTLNNGQANLRGGVLPALIAEGVAWRVMNEVLAVTSRVAWARLFVHFTDGGVEQVEYRGLYVVIEDLDRTAMRGRLGSGCGALLKTTTGRCRDEVDFDDGAPNDARGPWDAWVSASPGPDWATVSGGAFDLESLITQEAARDILGNGRDAVMGDLYNNYYRLEPRTGRAVFAPWDLDWAFDVYPLEVPPGTGFEPSCSPIGLKTRCHPALRKRYFERACELMRGPLNEARLLEHWHAVDAQLRPFVRDESAAVWGGTDPLEASVTGSYQASLERMEWWLPQHLSALRAAARREGVTCEASCEEGASQACSRAACAGTATCTNGRWSPCAVPSSAEVCNGTDDDCDGVIDEGCDLPKETCAQGAVAPRPNVSSCGCSQGDGVIAIALFLWGRRRLQPR